MNSVDQIRLDETRSTVKDLLIAYFKGQISCKESIKNVADLSKRRSFNVWEIFFSTLIDMIKKPQPTDRVKSFFWEIFHSFMEQNQDEQFCFCLQIIIINLARSNPNYSIFLSVLQAICEDPVKLEQLVRIPYCGGDYITQRYPEAFDSIFLFDFLNIILQVKLFVGLYGEDKIKDAERGLLSCLIRKIPSSFMWAFVLFGRPLFAAYRNLLPDLEASNQLKAGNPTLTQLQEFLQFVGISERYNFASVLDDIAETNSEGIPDWLSAFWRDALSVESHNAAKLSEDSRLFGLLVEFLYPKGFALQDAIEHSLVLSEDSFDSVSSYLVRYFESKCSQKLLNLVVSFDVEFVFEPNSLSLTHRNDKFSSGYVAQFLLQHRERIYKTFFVDYANSIEKLHQRYIQEHKLNISLILLFRQSVNQNFSPISAGNADSLTSSFDFFATSTGKNEPHNSILLFVSEYLSFDHLVILGNEFLLLDKIIENYHYLSDFADQIAPMNWSFKSSLGALMRKLLGILVSASIEYVDVHKSLESDALVYKTLSAVQLKDAFKRCSDACGQDQFLSYILKSFCKIGGSLGTDEIVNFKDLLKEQPDANKISVLKQWNQILLDPALKFAFLHSFSNFLSKRFMMKNVSCCFFDILVADFIAFQRDVFDLVVCDSFEAFNEGKIVYDSCSFPASSLIACLASNDKRFKQFTKMNFSSKYYERLLTDALTFVRNLNFSHLQSLPDSRLVSLHQTEVQLHGTRRIADALLPAITERVFGLQVQKMIFAKAFPPISSQSLVNFYLTLKNLQIDQFAQSLHSILHLLESCYKDDDVSVGHLNGFLLLFLQIILQKSLTDEKYLELFRLIINTPCFVFIFQSCKLKPQLLSGFLFDRFLNNSYWKTESWSFFGILFTLLEEQQFKETGRTYEYFIGYLEDRFIRSLVPFAEVILLLNVHGKLNWFEAKIIRQYFAGKNVVSEEMLDACVLHAERNPSLFLSLLSQRLDRISIYPRLNQRMEKQGYINNFIISANDELSTHNRPEEILVEVLQKDKLMDIIFWKKLTPVGWLSLFSLVTNPTVPAIGHAFIGYLERNLKNFDWLLENVFANYSSQDLVVLDCLAKVTVASDSMLNSLIQRCMLCTLFREAIERNSLVDPNRTAQFVIDEFVREDGVSSECLCYILSLLNSVPFYPPLLHEQILLSFVNDLYQFARNPVEQPQIASYKISLLLKCAFSSVEGESSGTVRDAIFRLCSFVQQADLFYLKRIFLPLIRVSNHA